MFRFRTHGRNLQRIFVECVRANVLLMGPHYCSLKHSRSIEVTDVLKLPEYPKCEQVRAVVDADFTIRKRNLQLVVALWHDRLELPKLWQFYYVDPFVWPDLSRPP